jgi:hypothetical protein
VFFGVDILLEATHHWETQEYLLGQLGFWFPSKEVFLCPGWDSEVVGCETPGGGFGERALGKVAEKHSCGIKKQIVGFRGGDTEGIPGAKVGSSESSKF